jgi:hypothetical protein
MLAAFAASAAAFLLVQAQAEARTVTYDVNGKQYSYESTSPRQVAAARRVIEAANALDRANAAALAERERNPFVALVGSDLQRAAAAAQANLARILEEEAAEAPAPRTTRQFRNTRDAGTASRSAASDAKAAAPERSGESTEKSAALTDEKPQAEPRRPAEPSRAKPEERPAVKSVFFDQSSGIKTTIMADGSIHEEMFDLSVLSRGASPASRGGADVAGQSRDSSPTDTTGSTTLPRKPSPSP